MRRLRDVLESLVPRLDLIELRPPLVGLAGDLAGHHRLRAGDAIHLASAVAVGDGELVVASWDAELRRAVGEVGLAVAPSRVAGL
jgi:predicted nucleic acid-binding protein